MKKITFLFVLLIFVLTTNLKAQYVVSEDIAGNYSTWSNGNNLGFGFGAWDIWNSGSGGVFIASSSGQGFGNIDTSSKAFGMWGNPSGGNQSNAQRTFGSNIWGDGATFSIQIATAYRNGYKGIDIFAPGWENVWNFNIGGDKYTTGGVDQTGWAYSQTSVFTLTVTQSGSNLNISLTRGGDSYSTTITNKSLFAFKLYVGSTNAGNDLNNLFFNNLKVSYSDVTKVPTSIRVDVQDNTTLSSDKTFSDLRINSSKEFTVAAGKQLTVSSALTNNGTIMLKSNATDGTATIKTPSTLSGSGTYNVEQYLTNHSWYVSSPVTGTTTPTNFSRIQSYIEGSGTGNDWSASGTTMVAKKGYITDVTSAPNTVVFTGTINSGDIAIPLTRQAETNANKYGFNLIGNPYPAYLDWTLVSAANTSKMPTSTMWYRTKVSGSWGFTTVNGSGVASPSNASYLIPPMQAFWVRASTVGNSDLNLTTTMVAHGDNAGNKLKAPSKSVADRKVVRLQVSNSSYSDELVIYTDAQALNNFDAYDSPKMFDDQIVKPEIFTTVGAEQLVINGMPTLPLDVEIPLGFRTAEAGNFSLKANEITNLEAGVKVVLKDNQNILSPETELTPETVYNFSSNVTDTNSRFSLIFKSAGTTTSITNKNEKNVHVFVKNQKIYVDLNSEQNNFRNFAVYTLSGLKLIELPVINMQTFESEKLNAGVYFVKLNTNNASVTRKVVINND